jgi:hypothetical protein
LLLLLSVRPRCFEVSGRSQDHGGQGNLVLLLDDLLPEPLEHGTVLLRVVVRPVHEGLPDTVKLILVSRLKKLFIFVYAANAGVVVLARFIRILINTRCLLTGQPAEISFTGTNGVTTVTIMTLGIMTLSITQLSINGIFAKLRMLTLSKKKPSLKGLFVTLSITILRIKCRYAECPILFVLMLIVVMQSVVGLLQTL